MKMNKRMIFNYIFTIPVAIVIMGAMNDATHLQAFCVGCVSFMCSALFVDVMIREQNNKH